MRQRKYSSGDPCGRYAWYRSLRLFVLLRSDLIKLAFSRLYILGGVGGRLSNTEQEEAVVPTAYEKHRAVTFRVIERFSTQA
jgi:hypothetical protein